MSAWLKWGYIVVIVLLFVLWALFALLSLYLSDHCKGQAKVAPDYRKRRARRHDKGEGAASGTTDAHGPDAPSTTHSQQLHVTDVSESDINPHTLKMAQINAGLTVDTMV
eukprot:m.31330 g.31330  ORF g.31330 m.31330 type:complete len:110 (-) comp9409_c0_seq1:489-818(-)